MSFLFFCSSLFLLSLLDDLVSFLSSDLLSSLFPHAVNTKKLVNNKNKYLFQTAKDAGVANFGKFNNYGYKGLYNGETAKQIAKRKSINEHEDILDYMGSEELGANLFRITQTEAKLKKDSVDNEKDACLTHYHVGKTVRKAIQELGGNMPETLSTPEKSIRELEKEELQIIGTNP